MTTLPDLPGWREVPMPAAIQALPRDANGMPVPFITEWSGTDVIRRDKVLGEVADCSCVIGENEPQLGLNCTARQLRSWRHRLCSTCGKKIRSNDGCWWFSLDENPMYTEPANHPECLAYSMQVCPHIRGKLQHDPDAAIVRARGYRLWRVRDPGPGDPNSKLVLVTPRTPPSVHKHHGVLIGYRARLINEHRTPARDWLRHRLDKENHR